MTKRWWLLAICLVVCAQPAAAQFFNVSRVARPSETTFANTGQPWPIPGAINAENYDAGGSGVAYSAVQNPAPSCQTTSYRADSINLKVSADGPAYQICSSGLGDLYNYTINVSGTGSGPYVLTARLADGAVSAGGLRGILIDNVQVATVATPLTGGYGNFAPAMSGQFNVSPGNHVLQFRTLALDSDGGAGDFSSFTIAPPSNVACDFGPSTTFPTGTAGTDLMAAGFTHCLLNADFTDNSNATVGGGWVMNNPATYLVQCGASNIYGRFWLMYTDAAGSPYDHGAAPCRATIANDGAGTNVLTWSFGTADINNPSGSQMIGLMWPKCGNACGAGPALPEAIYQEYTYRLINPGAGPITRDADQQTIYGSDANQCSDAPTHNGCQMDFDLYESGASWAQVSLDNYQVDPGCVGNKCSIGWVAFQPVDQTNYHTLADLSTTDGTTVFNTCFYTDGSLAAFTGATLVGVSGSCGHWKDWNVSGGLQLAAHDRRLNNAIGQFQTTLTGTVTMQLKSWRVFTCSNNAGLGNNCVGPLVFH